jgi:hypothetical protein
MSTLPLLHPKELAELSNLARRSLTNDEAQLLLREVTIFNAWEHWIDSSHLAEIASVTQKGDAA